MTKEDTSLAFALTGRYWPIYRPVSVFFISFLVLFLFFYKPVFCVGYIGDISSILIDIFSIFRINDFNL